MQNQSTLTDINQEELRRLDLHHSRNLNVIMSCVRVLKLEDLRRTNEDNQRLMQLMRSHLFFKGNTSTEYLWECCQLMKFQQFNKNQILYLRGRNNNEELIILLTGEIVITVNDSELLTTKHFGSTLILFGDDCYADMYSINSKQAQTSWQRPKQYARQPSYPNQISKLICYHMRLPKSIHFYNKFMLLCYFAHYHLQCAHYSCQDIIYQPNHKAQQIYLVISGIFEIREITETSTKSLNIYTPGQLLGDYEIVNYYPIRKQQAICISDEGSVLIFEAIYFLNKIYPNLKKSFVTKRTNDIKQTQKSLEIKKTLQKLFPEQPQEEPFLNRSCSKHFRFAKIANPRYFQTKQSPEKTHNTLNQNSLSINRSQQQLLTSNHKISIVSFTSKQDLFKNNIKGRLLRNELLNKFINQQSEYQDAIQNFRRTQSQLSMNK